MKIKFLILSMFLFLNFNNEIVIEKISCVYNLEFEDKNIT